MSARPRTLAMTALVVLPDATAYASGVDRVNLELLSDPPEGLSYRVLVGGEEKLAGDWPTDSRTLTMTWDYNAPFTLELSLNGTTSETAFSYAELARSVMTYGSGYWYLYGSECYDAAGSSVNTEVEFIHMAARFTFPAPWRTRWVSARKRPRSEGQSNSRARRRALRS